MPRERKRRRRWPVPTAASLRRWTARACSGLSPLIASIRGVCFSRDSNWIVTWGEDDKLVVTDLLSGLPVYENQFSSLVGPVGFTHDGQLIATCGFDANQRLLKVDLRNKPNAIAFYALVQSLADGEAKRKQDARD